MSDASLVVPLASNAARRRSRWRIARTLASCLLVGAIMNIAVAWAIALYWEGPDWNETLFRGRELADNNMVRTVFQLDRPGRTRRSIFTMERSYPFATGEQSPTLAVKSDHAPMSFPSWGRAEFARWSDSPEMLSGSESAMGWPLLSAWFESHMYFMSAPLCDCPAPAYELRGAWDLRTASRLEGPALPLRPIWPGLIINTLFYAALSWSLWLIPLPLRRARRRRRNLCLRCGYPRAGIAAEVACPECGASSAAKPKLEPRASGTKRDA